MRTGVKPISAAGVAARQQAAAQAGAAAAAAFEHVDGDGMGADGIGGGGMLPSASSASSSQTAAAQASAKCLFFFVRGAKQAPKIARNVVRPCCVFLSCVCFEWILFASTGAHPFIKVCWCARASFLFAHLPLQAAAAEAVKALQAQEEARLPRRYTVIGPITKRVVATPVLPPVHAS